ncbi:MAG: SspB family protein [Sphingopyxis sp.]
MSENLPPDSLIPYDDIVQEALRAVVGRVLARVVDAGGVLPGGHHFYITFKTKMPNVDIPAHLATRFPDEMTIVIENRFWDLAVHEDGFSVGLSFNQIGSILHIPFAAITAFVDPSVDFGLQFMVDADNDGPSRDDEDAADAGAPPAPRVTADEGSNVVTVDFGRKK